MAAAKLVSKGLKLSKKVIEKLKKDKKQDLSSWKMQKGTFKNK